MRESMFAMTLIMYASAIGIAHAFVVMPMAMHNLRASTLAYWRGGHHCTMSGAEPSSGSIGGREIESAYCSAVNGCWAGWQATFDTAGKLKPLDSKYLTDSMIEWGQVPTGLELLTSEVGGSRKFVLLYPEDGCANENLFGELTESQLDLGLLGGNHDLGVFTCDDAPGRGGPLWYALWRNPPIFRMIRPLALTYASSIFI